MKHGGKVAIVTGGGSGIGLAIAAAVAAEGVAVTLAGRDQKKLQRTAAQLEQKGGTILAMATTTARVRKRSDP